MLMQAFQITDAFKANVTDALKNDPTPWADRLLLAFAAKPGEPTETFGAFVEQTAYYFNTLKAKLSDHQLDDMSRNNPLARRDELIAAHPEWMGMQRPQARDLIARLASGSHPA